MNFRNLFRFAAKADPVEPKGAPVKPDVMDRYLASAVASTEVSLAAAQLMAQAGDPSFLWGWYVNRMRPGWPHLEAELDRAESMVAGAPVELLPCPASLRSRAKRLTGEAATASEVAGYCSEVLIGPGMRLATAVRGLMNGYWTGIGAFQYVVEPDGQSERLVSVERVSPHRFRFAIGTTQLVVQQTGDRSSIVPVTDLPGLVVFTPDAHIADPSRWGAFAKLLPYFLIQAWGPEWWSRAVERFGEPPRFGWYPKGDKATRDVLVKLLEDPGSSMWAALPEGARVEFLDVLSKSGPSNHQAILDWTNREASKLVLGATQTTDVQKDTGSKSSAGVHQAVVLEKAESNAKPIAACIREQLLVPLVSRKFGPKIAAKYTPELVFQTRPKPSLQDFAAALKSLVDAGAGAAIPLSVVNEVGGIPVPEDDEPTLEKKTPPALVPGAMPPSTPPDGAEPPDDAEDVQEPPEPGDAPVAGKSAARRALAAARHAKDDPGAELASLEEWALSKAGKAGAEILAPYQAIIDQAAREGASLQQLFSRVIQRAGMPLESPKLIDLLAAVQFEAVLRGWARERGA